MNSFVFPCHSVICTTLETNRYELADRHSRGPSVLARIKEMNDCRIKRKVITIEPVMDFDLVEFVDVIRYLKPAQVNIGADSGRNNLPEPGGEKIKKLIEELMPITIVHCKPNLKRLIGELP